MSSARCKRRCLLAIFAMLLEAACSTTAIQREPPEAQGIQFPPEYQGTPERLIIVTVVNDAGPAIRAGSTLRTYAGPMVYATSTRARKTVEALAGDYQLREVRAWPIDPLQVYCVVFEMPADGSRPELLKRLAADKRVKLAQPMQVFGTLTQSYNDPFVSLQHGFREIDVADAHQWSRGASVRVAIVDTGIDVSHPDLRGRVAMIRNFVDSDRAQFERDRHGTEARPPDKDENDGDQFRAVGDSQQFVTARAAQFQHRDPSFRGVSSAASQQASCLRLPAKPS